MITFGLVETIIIGILILLVLLLLYLVVKIIILAIPAFILAWVTYMVFGDLKIAGIVFIVTLAVTLLKKL